MQHVNTQWACRPGDAPIVRDLPLNLALTFDGGRRYGPDRKLFLPGGLLDPSEVPEYLNGTLAGE